MKKINFCLILFLSTIVNQSIFSQNLTPFTSTTIAPFNQQNFYSHVIDFDNDGDDDVFGWTTATNSSKLFRNNGNSSYTDVSVQYNFLKSNNIKSADFDKNGLMDVYSINSDTLNISINNGTSFSTPTLTCGKYLLSTLFNTTYSNLRSVKIWDFNNDGIYDIIAHVLNGSTSTVKAKIGSISCGSACSFQFSSNAPNSLLSISNALEPVLSFADVNNNGVFDLLIGNGTNSSPGPGFNNYNYSIYINNGSGAFTLSTISGYSIGRDGAFGSLGEFNNDGRTDIVSGAYDCCVGGTGGSNTINPIYVYFSNPTGGYNPSTSAMLRSNQRIYYYGLTAVDINLDKHQDILWTNLGGYAYASPALQCYINNGNSTFTENAAALAINLGTPNPAAMNSGQYSTILDINNDKKPDITIQASANSGYAANFTRINSTPNNGIKTRLIACNGLKEGWGARLKYKVGGSWHFQQHTSYSNEANYPFLYLGMATSTTIDSLVVYWVGGATSVLTNVPAGSYQVISETQNCSVGSAPTASINGTVAICSGNTANFTITGTPNAVVTYNLNGGTSATVTLNGTGSATVSVPNAASNQTLILLSVSNPTTNCSQPLSETATVIISVVNASISGNSSFCQGGSVTLIASGGGTYQWSNGLGTNASATISSPGTFSVVVTNTFGCTKSISRSVTMYQPPTINVLPQTICSGESVNLSADLSSPVLCGQASYVCLQNTTTFPAETNQPNDANITFPGNNYDCLLSQPNPKWFYLKIQTPGNMVIDISNSANVDVDFILYGPFSDLNNINQNCNNLGNGTGSNTVIDCSYSGGATESATISNCQVDQFYVLLITNYSNNQTDISMLNSGSATTSCSPIENLTGFLWSTGATTQSITSVPTVNTIYNVSFTGFGCASVSDTALVTVNQPIIPTFDSTGSYCIGDSIADLSVISNNGITGSWTPAINNLNTTTYTFYPTSGQCANLATLTIPVTPCACDTTNLSLDCDGDGVTNGDEIDPDGDGIAGPNGTSPTDSCSLNFADQSVAPSQSWLAADCDGDGVTNGYEVDPDGDSIAGPNGTDPTNPCSLSASSQSVTASSSWLSADCDGDGVTNGDEVDPDGDGVAGPNGTDPTNPCSLLASSQSVTASSSWLTSDCDGDGVTNGDEVDPNGDGTSGPNGTDPTNPCSFPSSSETAIACVSYLWNGSTYTASGTYTTTLTSINGCDSLATLNLTINETASSTEIVTACSFYTWNDNTYVESGTYTAQFVSANGCDSIATLNLTITFFEATATLIGTDLIEASPAGMTYQWINCITGEYITTALAQTYTATENGEYAVIVSDGQCSDQSDCITVSSASLEDGEVLFVNLYPNPTSGDVILEVSSAFTGRSYQLVDYSGRVILNGTIQSSKEILSLSDLARGVYYLNLDRSIGAVKVVKQ
jgi:hypothetical protein